MNTCSPTRPIPFDLLRVADADLTLNVADLRSGGADYKAIDTHAVLKNGKLTVDPFAADLPGGHLTGTLSADATQTAPPVHLVLHAPGLALQTILAAAHQPSYASGNLEVYANLTGDRRQPSRHRRLPRRVAWSRHGRRHHRQPSARQPARQGHGHAQRARPRRQGRHQRR